MNQDHHPVCDCCVRVGKLEISTSSPPYGDFQSSITPQKKRALLYILYFEVRNIKWHVFRKALVRRVLNLPVHGSR